MVLGARSRLFLVSLTLVLAASLSSAIFLERKLRPLLERTVEVELLRHARMVRETLVARGGERSIEAMNALADRLGVAASSRVTMIRDDGVVLGDSNLTEAEVRAVENHASRPEVIAALATGAGSARRYSATLRTEMLYVAVRYELLDGSGVARVALPLIEVESLVRRLRFFVALAGLVGLVVATFMSVLAANLLVRPFRSLVDKARALARGERSRIDVAPAGEIGHLAGSLNRISSDLEQAVSALADERDRFHTVLDAMADAVITLDAANRVTLANPMAMEYLGLRVPPLARPLAELIRVPELEQLLSGDAPVGPVSLEFELPVARRMLTRITPIRTGGGHIIVMHDVTEIRRLETIRRDFVANVSHELRTPISVILANSETLTDGGVPDVEQASRFLAAIHSNAERLSRLIADLLDLSKIEAGRYPLALCRMEIEPELRSAIESMHRTARKKKQTIEFAGADARKAVADPAALEHVLLNLLDNAVKYTQEGGRIAVELHSTDEEVRIDVVDDGPGIEPHHRSRLFERFYRVDPGRSRELGGTGLGLAIVKHLVESMGGGVGVEPAAPHGSRFWFTLPTRFHPDDESAPSG